MITYLVEKPAMLLSEDVDDNSTLACHHGSITSGINAERRATEITVLTLVVLSVLYRRMELRKT